MLFNRNALIGLLVFISVKICICDGLIANQGNNPVSGRTARYRNFHLPPILSAKSPPSQQDSESKVNKTTAPVFTPGILLDLENSPKPSSTPNQQVWQWAGEEKGWSAVGWISVPTTCSVGWSQEASTTVVTETISETETTVITSMHTGWAVDTGTDYLTIYETETEVEYETSTSTEILTTTETIDVTNVHTQTSIVSTTKTSTSFVTSTQYETSTFTSTVPGGWGWGNVGNSQDATVVIESSMQMDYITSTVIEYHTVTIPLFTESFTITSTVITDIETAFKNATFTLSDEPSVTETRIIATPTVFIVETSETTISSTTPICTITKVIPETTVTTPTRTITASQCRNKCYVYHTCSPTCTTTTTTRVIEITSVSVTTAPVSTTTYIATSTLTSYVTPNSTAVIDVTSTSTISSTKQSVSTSTLSGPPVTIMQSVTTTTKSPATVSISKSCSSTIYETHTEWVTPSTRGTIVSTYTGYVEVVKTITSTSTSYVGKPIPTTTVHVPGDVTAITSTKTITQTVEGEAATTYVTSGSATVGYGWTTLTPSTVVIKTNMVTSTLRPVTAVVSTSIRTLIVSEPVTSICSTKTVDTFLITTEVSTKYSWITPSPTTVIQTTLVVTPTVGAGWSAGWGHY